MEHLQPEDGLFELKPSEQADVNGGQDCPILQDMIDKIKDFISDLGVPRL